METTNTPQSPQRAGGRFLVAGLAFTVLMGGVRAYQTRPESLNVPQRDCTFYSNIDGVELDCVGGSVPLTERIIMIKKDGTGAEYIARDGKIDSYKLYKERNPDYSTLIDYTKTNTSLDMQKKQQEFDKLIDYILKEKELRKSLPFYDK